MSECVGKALESCLVVLCKAAIPIQVDCLVNRFQEFDRADRFQEHMNGPAAHELHRSGDVGSGRHKDQRQDGPGGREAMLKLKAAHVRNSLLEDQPAGLIIAVTRLLSVALHLGAARLLRLKDPGENFLRRPEKPIVD